MFTGFVTDVGTIAKVTESGDTRFVLSTQYDVSDVEIGASIACSGVCLTVVDKGKNEESGNWFAVDASAETLSCSNLGDWREGTPVNLEKSLKVGDELGGHIVSGHVDGVAEVVNIRPEGDSLRFEFLVPSGLKKFIAPKGAVALNGVSLTVNEVDDARFGVNVIPHTQKMTTFGSVSAGDRVNLEIDVLARYVARLNEVD
jgi:riboflavin synthase